jgi:CRISPR-associated endonuclease Csn1
MNPDNVTVVKEQTYKSSKDYKNFVYADSGENYLFGLYENENGRTIISFNIFESANYSKILGSSDNKELFRAKEPIYIGRGRNKKEAVLIHIFQVGQKVLFFENDKEEIKDLEEKDISRRLYFVKNLADANSGRIRFQHHIDARSDKQLNEDFPEKDFGKNGINGFSKFSTDFIAPRLLLTPGNFNFIIEGKDFKMKLDGAIEFNF